VCTTASPPSGPIYAALRAAIRKPTPPLNVIVTSGDAGPKLSAHAILTAVCSVRKCERILVEGGPHLLGDFFSEGCLDELFLTQSPQVARRDSTGERAGLVQGKTLAPDRLLGIKRAEEIIYSFAIRSDRRESCPR
jgi:riboflavin biosynthesis pyrimidine reductase